LTIGLLVDQGAELVGEGGHVRHAGFEVEVESIEGDIIKGTLHFGTFLDGTKGLPHQLGSSFCIILVLEAALAVSGTADGQENGFTLLLALFDVLTAEC
jgi:hypothetical protein